MLTTEPIKQPFIYAFVSYYELNADIVTGTPSKYTNLPDVFRNRPRWVIDHISERITSSYDISCDDIIVDSYKEGEFLVNCRRSDVEYKVQLAACLILHQLL